MIEVVFSESAAGSLKMAQSYGKGEFKAPAIAIMVRQSDGRKATKAEIEALKCKEEERAHLDWENAVPMGGNSSDIFSFSLAHSVGDITGNGICENRLAALNYLFGNYPQCEGASAAKEIFDRAVVHLKILQKRLSAGEAVRLWYSEQPDEMCGLYWFMSQAAQWNTPAKLYVVKLPDWEAHGHVIITHTGWGEVTPGEWHKYVNLQKEVSAQFVSAAASRWKELQRDNSPLRAVINGELQSVPEDFYDCFINRELATQDNQFHEARLIGNILGNYQLGISDG